jgi:hypothetical protein
MRKSACLLADITLRKSQGLFARYGSSPPPGPARPTVESQAHAHREETQTDQAKPRVCHRVDDDLETADQICPTPNIWTLVPRDYASPFDRDRPYSLSSVHAGRHTIGSPVVGQPGRLTALSRIQCHAREPSHRVREASREPASAPGEARALDKVRACSGLDCDRPRTMSNPWRAWAVLAKTTGAESVGHIPDR